MNEKSENISDLTSILVNELDCLRFDLSNTLISKNCKELCVAINLAVKYTCIILKYDLLAFAHVTKKNSFSKVVTLIDDRIDKINEDIVKIKAGEQLEKPSYPLISSDQMIILGSIIVMVVMVSYIIVGHGHKSC